MTEHWNWLLKKAVESLSVDVFKPWMDVVLDKLIDPTHTEQEGYIEGELHYSNFCIRKFISINAS